jgi:hypothetical protein
MNSMHRLATFGLFGLIAASSAFAADAPAAKPGGALAEACAADVQKLCPGTQPGEGRIKACLKDNRAKLSDGCKAAIKGARAERKAAK